MFRKGGPSRKQVEKGSFTIFFKGLGWSEGQDRNNEPATRVTTKVVGPHPGYPACATCVNQAALTLLNETDLMPQTGGVYTTATAYRKTSLVDRLNQNGIKFSVVEQ